MSVENTNIFSEPRTLIKDLINTNIVDPKIGFVNSRRRWFYRQVPDTTSNDFAGYPYIVISSPEGDSNEVDLQGQTSDFELDLSVEVFVEFNDTNARVDSLSNDVYATLNSYANKKQLARQNLHLVGINAGPYDDEEIDGKKINTRKFTITYTSTIFN